MKKKDYKTFSYPNDLSPIEQYFYYLGEFGVLPKELPPVVIEKIYEAMAIDYLEGHIDIEKFECMSANLYFKNVIHKLGVLKPVERLMTDSSDVTWYGDKAVRDLTTRLRDYYKKE